MTRRTVYSREGWKTVWRGLTLGICSIALTGTSAAQTKSVPDPLTDAKSKKAVVLFFIGHDCPISNAYAPEIKRICARYAPQRISFYLVYTDPDLSLAAAHKHAKEYGYLSPVVLDAGHRLSCKTGATVTPEAAVVGPNGKLLYRGRIDDLYIGFGKQRYAATQHDLRNALDAIAQGKPVSKPFTRAIGCFIPNSGPQPPVSRLSSGRTVSTVQIGTHYHPTGKRETDQSSIGLYFTDTSPIRKSSLIVMGVLKLDISPGDSAHLE